MVKSTNITIDANFEGGNLGDIRQIAPNHFSGKVASKLGEPVVMWFYFRIEGNKGDEVLVDVHNIGHFGSFSTEVNPVISYHDKEWERIRIVHWAKDGSKQNRQTLSLTIEMKEKMAWVAFCFPYVYSDLESYLREIEGNKNVRTETLCLSPQKRRVYLVTLTESAEEDKDKIGVWVIAREHAGEVTGSYVCEGLIDFLLSEDKIAQRLRKDFVFKIVPMADVDGVGIGAYGKDQWPLDFARDWVEHPTIPIVQSIKDAIDAWAKTHPYRLFFTIHAPDIWQTNHIYTFSKRACSASLKYYYDEQHKFMKLMETFSPPSNKIYASNYEETMLPGTSTVYQYIKHSVLVFALEVSYQQALPEGEISIDSLRTYGKGLAKAIYHFYS